MGDTHCGHYAGLTPRPWQLRIHDDDEQPEPRWNKYAKLQAELWGHYTKIAKAIQPVDILLFTGDAIDGRGERSGQTELITANRTSQCDMAVQTIKLIHAKDIVMVYGTPYHTGGAEDWEDQVAERVDARKIGGHEWADVNGTIFDIKHKIGSSSIPHGRHTAIARDRMWNVLWADRMLQPRANITIRGHVHYFNYCGGPDWVGLTAPALQGMGSKFGSRQCSGLVDWGLVVFDVDQNGSWTWSRDQYIIEIVAQRASPIVL